MSISSCSSLKTSEMLQQQAAAQPSRTLDIPNIVLMAPTRTFNSTKEIETEIEKIDETSLLRKAHVYKCLFDLVKGMPDALIQLILEYSVPSKLTRLSLESVSLQPRILYGIEINDNSSLIPFSWSKSSKQVLNGIRGAAFYGREGHFSAIIQEREPLALIPGKAIIMLTTWDTDSAMQSKDINLRINHITADHRRKYNIWLPDENSFYKIYQIDNPVDAAKFEKVTLIYDSRKPPIRPYFGGDK